MVVATSLGTSTGVLGIGQCSRLWNWEKRFRFWDWQQCFRLWDWEKCFRFWDWEQCFRFWDLELVLGFGTGTNVVIIGA
jgi:hypothetical protein